MKKRLLILIVCLSLCGCGKADRAPEIVATTLPVYEFTDTLCKGTGLSVGRLVTEDISCLHNYTLQISQMRMLNKAELVVLSGAGTESFLELGNLEDRIDASENILLLDSCHHQEENNHHHEKDGHIWLSPANAKVMAQNICKGLSRKYPAHRSAFEENLTGLLKDLNDLQSYGEKALSQLQSREIITFHDGFTYLADAFSLTILHAIEEESGSEASAAELIELICLTREHQLPAIFTERSGSTAAAEVVSSETGAGIYALDMAMAGDSYFTAMYHNIDTLKEALG